MDAKTIKIPAFSYDGKGEEVYFFAGEGPQPSSKVPATSVADPDPRSGTFLTPGSGDPGWVKNQDPDPGSGTFLTPGSGDPGWVKNQDPDPGSERLETIFWVGKHIILYLERVSPGFACFGNNEFS